MILFSTENNCCVWSCIGEKRNLRRNDNTEPISGEEEGFTAAVAELISCAPAPFFVSQ